MSNPRSLLIVSWCFRVQGILAAVGIVSALAEPRISLDFNLLGLWIGPGLLRHEVRYRTWGVRLLVFSIVLSAVGLVVTLTTNQPPDVHLFGHRIATVPRAVMLGAVALGAAITVWQYMVLRQPSIRALFKQQEDLGDPLAASPDAEVSDPVLSV